VRVTVIAAGFDGGEPTLKSKDARRGTFVGAGAAPAAASASQSFSDPEQPVTAPVDHAFDDDDDDLDVPDFLK
jgi:cell division protein FtsZ